MKPNRLGGAAVVAVSLLTIAGGLGATGWGLGTTTLRAATFGAALALLSALRIVGGVGMMRGRRWGFALAAALSALSIPLDLGHLDHHTGLYGLPLNAAILVYCLVRMTKTEKQA